ncbi:MAG: MXAN_6640 family putative metalloprotease [Phototrophicaceae bacterium]
MKLRLFFLTLIIILMTSLTSVAQLTRDNISRVQEFFTYIDEDNPIAFFDLFSMDEGTKLYVYAESYDIDTFIGICDIDCGSDFFEFNNDIDGRRNRNSAFSYTFDDLEDYTVFVRDCCDNEAGGVVRILIGLEAPEVLTGEAFPTGDPFAVIYQPTYIDLTEIDYDDDETQVQQFYGEVDADNPFIYYDLNDVEAGQTLYIYAESYEIDTAVGICGEGCDEILIYEDDIASDNFNTALTYTFKDDGDYQIIVGDCCDDDAEGVFRLLLGYNDPQIIENNILPNGAQVASEYEAPRSLVQTDIDRNTEVINENCDGVDLNERPELSGDTETVSTENFVIHYTQDGDDAADEDFVDEVVAFVETVLDIHVNQLGWAAPPRDCGEGGDSRYDFYLINILDNDGILGYADPQELVGDNPASDIEEEWAAYGYMVIDNDYDGVSNPLVVMRATVAHEFHHLIQFGYDIGDEAFWLYEATASWIETVTSTEEEDATGYTQAVFNEPNLCIGNRDDRTGLRIYGEWLLIDSIAQDFGNESIVTLWETIVDKEGMDAFYEFLDQMDTTPEDVLRRYAIRNLLLDYTLGTEFPTTVDVEEVIEDFETYDSGRDGVEEMAVQYLSIRDNDVYTFELDNDDLTMVVVGVNPDDNDVDIYEIGQEGTIDTTDYDYTYIIVMNTQQHDESDDCNEEDWEIEVSDGSDDDLSEPNDESFDVSNFDPAD